MKIKFWKSHETNKWHWILTGNRGRVVERSENLHDIHVCMAQVNSLADQYPDATIEYRAKPAN